MTNTWCHDKLLLEAQLNSQKQFESAESLEISLIPRIIHLIWVGSNLPTHLNRIIDHCKELHPDWEVRVWTDDDIKSLPSFHNASAFDSATNYGM